MDEVVLQALKRVLREINHLRLENLRLHHVLMRVRESARRARSGGNAERSWEEILTPQED